MYRGRRVRFFNKEILTFVGLQNAINVYYNISETKT